MFCLLRLLPAVQRLLITDNLTTYSFFVKWSDDYILIVLWLITPDVKSFFDAEHDHVSRSLKLYCLYLQHLQSYWYLLQFKLHWLDVCNFRLLCDAVCADDGKELLGLVILEGFHWAFIKMCRVICLAKPLVVTDIETTIAYLSVECIIDLCFLGDNQLSFDDLNFSNVTGIVYDSSLND